MEKNMYQQIIKIASIFLIIACIITYMISFDVLMAISIVVGGITNILGFIYIIIMVNNLDFNKNVSAIVVGHYLIRYLIYIGIFSISYMIGLNILTMLIGFLCIHFGIIVYTKLDERRKIN